MLLQNVIAAKRTKGWLQSYVVAFVGSSVIGCKVAKFQNCTVEHVHWVCRQTKKRLRS